MIIDSAGQAGRSIGPMMAFFKRRKAAYQAFVEKRAGQLEKFPPA
jgi:hypothetical protein